MDRNTEKLLATYEELTPYDEGVLRLVHEYLKSRIVPRVYEDMVNRELARRLSKVSDGI